MNTSNNNNDKASASFENNSQRQVLDGHTVSGSESNTRLLTGLERAFGAFMQHLQDRQAWRDQMTADLDTVGQTTMENSDALCAVALGIERLEAAFQKEADARAAQHASLVNLETQLAQLSQANGAQAYNIEQLRLQGEGLARNFEKVSQEFIAREIKDPFFVAFARLYEAVLALRGREWVGDDDLQFILNRIKGFLEDNNIEIIHPDDGEPLDPRRHQPVKRVSSPDADKHGRIASTFNVGLVNGQRLIQLPRVAVFFFTDTSPVNQKNTNKNNEPKTEL